MKNEIIKREESRKLIVYIGRAAGKHKYSLIDEEDIPMVKRFRFEARLDYSKDGNGAKVYAFAFDRLKERHHGCFVHDYVWQKRCGHIAPGFRIKHRNGVTVDNRLQNLELVPESISQSYESKTEKREDTGLDISCEETLYWKAISQIPLINPEDVLLHQPAVTFDLNGDFQQTEDKTSFFYECHYTPCCRIEKEVNDFRTCGRCEEVRYCGPSCQQKDWPAHKPSCISNSKVNSKQEEKLPER